MEEKLKEMLELNAEHCKLLAEIVIANSMQNEQWYLDWQDELNKISIQ